jgi:FMN phosphatase YigB (HAD superfamily)
MSERVEGAGARPTVEVLILDLDNTLFDWVDIWYRSFKPMLDSLVAETGASEEQLKGEIKKVHQKHGTSEYAFLFDELPTLKKKAGDADVKVVFQKSIEAYREGRRSSLALYPGVLETLEAAKDAGTLLVGFTDSRAFYTRYRLRKLGLDRILDYLYSPPDHGLPPGKKAEDIRKYPTEHYEFRRTVHKVTPEGVRKPSKQLLEQIMKEVGVTPSQVAYVGDSLMKDISMAQDAGVLDIYAQYGASQDRSEYEFLRDVTHWTPEEVQREKDLKRTDVNPTIVLKNGFEELLTACRFSRFRGEPTELEKLVVQMWSRTIDTQEHFNDLELRIRNYAVTLLVAIVGVSAFAAKEDLRLPFMTVGGTPVAVASVLLLAGALSWGVFYLMDRHWYHRLLYGAVKHGAEIEGRWERRLPEMGLTSRIGKESPSQFRLGIGRWRVEKQVHSPGKVDLFYLLVGMVILALAGTVQCGAKRSLVPGAVTPTPKPSPAAPTVAPTSSSAPSGETTPSAKPSLTPKRSAPTPPPPGTAVPAPPP